MLRTLFLIVFALIVTRAAFSAQLPPLEQLTPQNLHRLQQVGLIQRGTVEELAWSPDETQIAAVGSAGLRVYTVDSGRERLLLGHLGSVNDVDFSPDGQVIASAGDDGTLRLWDPRTGRLLRSLDPYADLECDCTIRLTSAKFTADGLSMWVGADNGPLRVVDAASGATLAEDARNVLEIVPDADRSRFAVTEQRSSRMTIWLSSGGFAPSRELDMRFTIWNAAFVPQTSQLLVAGFVGAELVLVDADTGETVEMVRGSRVLHTGSGGTMVTQVIDWIGDLRRISLRVSDIDSGTVRFNAGIRVELTDARFSPSGDRLAYSDVNGALSVIDWRLSVHLLDVAPKGTALVGLALLDGGLVASIDSGVGVVQTLTRDDVPAGQTVRFWEIRSGLEAGWINTSDHGLDSADVLYWDARSGRLIVASTAQPELQLEVDPATRDVRRIDIYNVALLADEQYVAVHPDGLLRAAANSTDDVRVMEGEHDGFAFTLPAAGPGLGFSRDGTLLLTSGLSGVIRLWGVPTTVPAPD